MSSILQGLNDNVEIAENSSAELRAKLENVESLLGTRTDRDGKLYNEYVNEITKPIKWLSNDGLVLDIDSGIRQLAEKIGISLEDEEDAVREAWSQLESATWDLGDPFLEYVKDLRSEVMQAEVDAEDLDEAGTNCWKGYKKKGTKKMFGKTVNNCVKKEDVNDESLTELNIKKDIVQPTGALAGGAVGSVVGGVPGAVAGAVAGNKISEILADAFGEAFTSKSARTKKQLVSVFKRFLGDKVEETAGFDQDAFDNIFKDRKPKAPEAMKSRVRHNRGSKSPSYDRSRSYKDDFKRNELDFELGHEDLKEKKKSSMGKVMEMYDDVLYLMYIDGKLAMPTPIEKSEKIRYERGIKNALPGSEVQFKGVRRGDYSAEELAEGNGNIRKALAGIILIGGLLGLENHQAQKMYNQSHQLQQLTQVYMVAKERGDEAKMKDVKRRIGNHKTRLDIGKGDVDFDGRPGNDDIKDIDYINPIEER